MKDWQNRMISESLRPRRVEIAAALAGADALSCQRILEDLLEPQETDDTEIDGRVKPESSLEGPKSTIELDTVSAVDLHGTGVIDPRDAEHDLAFGFEEPVEDAGLDVLRMPHQDRLEVGEDFVDGLMEDGFRRAAAPNGFGQVRDIRGCRGVDAGVHDGHVCFHSFFLRR
jgi:hypothetical protein